LRELNVMRGGTQNNPTPRLRLVRDRAAVMPRAADGSVMPAPRTPGKRPARDRSGASTATRRKLANVGKAITGPSDPRWVLAVRTAESLEGAMLRPERRERLLRIARLMGLTPFDANIIIAIVQDQARRGFEAEYCPIAGEPQLEMVPLPRRHQLKSMLPANNAMKIAAIIAAMIATEILLLRLFF